MYKISEFARLTGVSVRTLHYYDEIGLLSPCSVDEQNGYRYYDDSSLSCMQEILFYRELDFPLKRISEIILSPDYDKGSALMRQRQLLVLKKERLERLICAIDSAAEGEVTDMKAFDNSEFEAARDEFAREARERWGDTEAYKEFEQKDARRSDDDRKKGERVTEQLTAEFASLMKSGAKPSDSSVQALVQRWQDNITENYYTCTKEILAGLGAMYSGDERFAGNLDRHGKGTAEFIAKAIEIFCK